MEHTIRTEAQHEASRRNGAQSNGPATPEGKARSAQNATKHGLFSSRTVLANESQEEFDNSYLRYCHEWNPIGQSEVDLVRDITIIRWKYNRICNADDAARDSEMFIQRPDFDQCYDQTDPGMRHHDADNAINNTSPGLLEFYGRSMARFQRMLTRATRDLIRLQKMRLGHLPVRNVEPLTAQPTETEQDTQKSPNEPEPRQQTTKTYAEPEVFTRMANVDRTKLCPLKGPKEPPAPKHDNSSPYLDHLRV